MTNENINWPEMSKTNDGPMNTVETTGDSVCGPNYGTHWSECWRTHHACAVARVEELEEELRTCRNGYKDFEILLEVAGDDYARLYDKLQECRKKLERGQS